MMSEQTLLIPKIDLGSYMISYVIFKSAIYKLQCKRLSILDTPILSKLQGRSVKTTVNIFV